MKKSFLVIVAVIFCMAGLSMAQEIPAKPLLNSSALEKCVQPSTDQVKITRADGTSGAVVTIAPGADPFPGIRLKPQDGPVWDLSAYGHVEAQITNVGAKKVRLNLRVDNPHDGGAPWNTEVKEIEAGQSAKISVIFGFQFGNQAFPVNPSSVAMVLLFTGKTDEAISLRVDSIAAAGPPGEKPVGFEKSLRVKPKDGVILGGDVAIDAAKQFDVKNAATANVDGANVAVTYTNPNGKFTFKPVMGRWHLGDANEVAVKLRNTGAAELVPTITLYGDQTPGPKITAPPLAAGAEEEVVLPFTAATPWQGVPADERKPGHDTIAGTGTNFPSDKTDAVEFTVDRPGSLQIESITARRAAAELPEWLGKRPPVEGDWKQTLSDDFDATAVDLTKWNNFGPNYWDKVSHWSKEDVIIGDGVLRLRAEKKTGTQNDDPKGKQTDLAGGYLDSFDKFSQRYGYFEARMKLPTSLGLWPAFWLMPDRGPNAGDTGGSHAKRGTTSNGGMEFDIMEHLTVWGPCRYNVAMHWDDYGPNHKSTGTGKIYVAPDKDGFITCGLLWEPGKAVYYCNGVEVARWEDARVSDVPSFILFTVPRGGWDGNQPDGTGLPDDFVIDYVRVWQRSDLATAEIPATQPAR